jgi:hypothetical protein
MKKSTCIIKKIATTMTAYELSQTDSLYILLLDVASTKKNGGGMGIDKVTKRTGLTEHDVHTTISNHLEQFTSILEEMNFGMKINPSMWYGLTPTKHYELDAAKYKALKGEERKQYVQNVIYDAMKELTSGFDKQYARTISGFDLATKMKAERRFVDKHLSDHSNEQMRDCEYFRKVGKQW